jgi:hypothetical protein
MSVGEAKLRSFKFEVLNLKFRGHEWADRPVLKMAPCPDHLQVGRYKIIAANTVSYPSPPLSCCFIKIDYVIYFYEAPME